jgi:cholesterol transport system auxiliary component
LNLLRACALTLVLFAGALSAGCSGLFHSSAKAEQAYYLRATATPAGTGQPLPVALRVAAPEAGPGLDTTRIMLVQSDHRMGFYSGSRWPSAAPKMVETLAVQTLRASGDWASVQDAGSPFPSDYLLQLTLRRFEADYGSGAAAPEVHVVLDAVLGRRDVNDVVASFEVSGAQAAGENRMGAVVAAFEQATNSALAALAQQAAAAARAQAQPAGQNAVKPVPSSSR